MKNRTSTEKLYWQDDHCLEAEATVLDTQNSAIAFDRTCFYPGGGGQPHDTGVVEFLDGNRLDITSVQLDGDQVIWHTTSNLVAEIAHRTARLMVNASRRNALARYHSVLHVLNTIALRDFGAWMTGVQINETYSRIDFKLEDFSIAVRAALEQKVNAVLSSGRIFRSYFLLEQEFQSRNDLLRTLDAMPTVINGRVRVVEIEGFDAQACGGTHVSRTSEIGRFTIYKTENKGKINKRLYVRIE